MAFSSHAYIIRGGLLDAIRYLDRIEEEYKHLENRMKASEEKIEELEQKIKGSEAQGLVQ